MGEFLVGLVFFVLGASYVLAPFFSREATWQTGGACSPTLLALTSILIGFVAMVSGLSDLNTDDILGRDWFAIVVLVFLIVAFLLGERWRRRIVRPSDLLRRGEGGASLSEVARARFEEKRRKEKQEAERIVKDEETSVEKTQAPAPPRPNPPRLGHHDTDSQALPYKGDIYQEIRKLAELRDEGLITSEEFEEKKRELLGRL